MELSLLSLLAVIVIFAASSYLQSATGFGLALVALAFLPLLMPVKEAVSLVTAFTLFITVSIMWWNHTGFCLRSALPLIGGMLAGVPLGYFFLRSLDGDSVVRVLGAVLVALALLELAGSKLRGLSMPSWTAAPFGLGGGLLAGAFNVGGPPVVVFAYSQDWSKTRIVSVLQAVFIGGGLCRNGLMIAHGEYTLRLLGLVAIAVPPALAAVWLGKKTLDRVSLPVLRRVVFGLVLLIGVGYLVRG